jgi:hypothetical protein
MKQRVQYGFIYIFPIPGSPVSTLGLPGQKSNICQEHAHTTNDIPTCSARAN